MWILLLLLMPRFLVMLLHCSLHSLLTGTLFAADTLVTVATLPVVVAAAALTCVA